MPTTEISNHAIYVIAREQYLKGLLELDILTQEQFEQMDRFMYKRLNISEIENYSYPTQDISPVNTLRSKDKQQTTQVLPKPDSGYVSLTDMARQYNNENPGYVIQSWIRNPNTFELLHLWESANNTEYKEQGYEEIKEGTPTSSLTPKRWIENTGAIGIISRQGQNGGTYAHPVIAGDFLTWLSPKFKLLMLEFQKGFVGNS